ncbi:MAG: DNA adenine methylase [Psychroserpens sp.]|uniref:DNA adenine methylase n=1 Tax=Psychroserpens sp. TaxID=2020870 RepID=UPI003C8967BB
MNKKTYKTSPLPFMGQKRRFVKDFNEALDGYSPKAVYIDLFGGSGLLSHTVKAKYPEAKVIFNDYDNFRQRINAIPETNILLVNLRKLLQDWPSKKRVDGKMKDHIISTISEHEKKFGYVDFITLSGSLLFSGKHALDIDEMKKCGIYNRVRVSDFDATGYLEGLEVVSQDYKVLFDQYAKEDDVVFLIDPPYLQTSSKTYKNYWKLRDYLDVLTVMNGQRYFYFTSNKSSIIELCEWIGDQTVTSNLFANATRKEVSGNVNYASSYTDIMLFK